MASKSKARTLVAVSRELRRAVDSLSFGKPIEYVYNPLAYARAPHEAYLERYGAGAKEVLLVGMNPGPFGMAQTGVPFGDVELVRGWLEIEGRVGKPPREHPKRPIQGFACTRSEISGSRLWGWARERFGTPEAFFDRFFVANYCPLVFMEASSRNFTPDKLRAAERAPLLEVCDRALRRTVEIARPDRVIGIGTFAQKRAREALAGLIEDVGVILHPSPASPKANRGWAAEAERELTDLGVRLPKKPRGAGTRARARR